MTSPAALVAFFAAMVLAVVPGPAGNAPAARRTPVLVELFTSEGCSSCPPADRAFTRLIETQPVASVEIVPLALHVDYWNRLGWADPFSSSEFSRRQGDYSRAFGGDRIYTPQMIVDGTTEFVGGDEAKAVRAVEAAAAAKKAEVLVERAGPADAAGLVTLRFTVRGAAALDPGGLAELFVAITEDGLSSSVARGENAGRTLRHSAVARDFQMIGRVKGDDWSAERTLRLDPAWRKDALHVVAFVQTGRHLRVLGAARIRL